VLTPFSSDSIDTPLYDGVPMFCEDSIFSIPDQSLLPDHSSLFVGHEMPVRHYDAVPHETQDDGGYIFAFSVGLALLLMFFLLFRKMKLKNVLMASFSDSKMSVLIRDSKVKNDFSLFPIPLIYYSALAMTAYIAMRDIYQTHIWGVTDLPFMIGVLMSFSLIRHSLIKLLGFICGESATIKNYTVASNLFQMMGAILAIPLVIIAGYVNVLYVWVVLAVVGLVFLLRLARGLAMVLSRSGVSKLYLFYYLCIIEIVPILIVVKILITL